MQRHTAEHAPHQVTPEYHNIQPLHFPRIIPSSRYQTETDFFAGMCCILELGKLLGKQTTATPTHASTSSSQPPRPFISDLPRLIPTRQALEAKLSLASLLHMTLGEREKLSQITQQELYRSNMQVELNRVTLPCNLRPSPSFGAESNCLRVAIVRYLAAGIHLEAHCRDPFLHSTVFGTVERDGLPKGKGAEETSKSHFRPGHPAVCY